MAFFMIDSLVEALKLLQHEAMEGNDVASLLEKYQSLEDADYKLFEDSFEAYKTLPVVVPHFDEPLRSYVPDLFDAKSSFCHTALLPSRSRYLNYVTHNAKYNSTAYRFDEALKRVFADEIRYELGAPGTKRVFHNMTLVRATHQHENDFCPILISVDFPDYFFASQDMGWNQLFVPDRDYLAAYEAAAKQKADIKGLVIVCRVLCPW